MCTLMLLANLGVQGLPAGPLAACPVCCCGGEPSHPGIHINVDFCFGLPHLARCGTSIVKQLPPNHQLYLDSPAADGLLSGGSSDVAADAQAEAERACSDFDAAKALGRTSEKASCAQPGLLCPPPQNLGTSVACHAAACCCLSVTSLRWAQRCAVTRLWPS